MKTMTFTRGGIHPAGHKITAASEITAVDPPDTAYIPLSQHIGAPAKALVAVGDKVKVGTLIAEAQGNISAPVHSSVSGTVSKIDTVVDSGGFRRPAIIVKREGDEWEDGIDKSAALVTSFPHDPNRILDMLRDGGLVGKGGATFPTRVKYLVPPGKFVDTLIINGVECEPWLTSDHRLMLERTDEVIMGVEILRYTLGVKLAVIAVEENKKDAIELLSRRVREMGLEAPADYVRLHLKGKGVAASANPERTGGITVVALATKYPQGAEKQVIKAVLAREVPSGKLPLDVGVIVNNVATAHSAYKIVQKHKPMFERIVTVSGDSVARPGNYKFRIGTPLSEVLEFAGAKIDEGSKIILGGPMMGKAVPSLDVPLSKGVSGVLVLAESHRAEIGPCIRCARCSSVCPMGLDPWFLERMVLMGRYEEAAQRGLSDCVECGSCAWICPSSRSLLDSIKVGKVQLQRAAKKQEK